MKAFRYPLLFHPVYKDYLWGGDRLRRIFHRQVTGAKCAESWEISSHPDGESVVANGALAGMGLARLVKGHSREIIGTRTDEGFPLIVKIIDARANLSVQVHPGRRMAAVLGGRAKTEMWYSLSSDDGAAVFCGLKKGIGRRDVAAALSRGGLERLLRRVPVSRGTAVYVPAGTVHAVGRGCLLLEIQQNSNTTYRLFDWNRLGVDGCPRPLHVGPALKSIETRSKGCGKVLPVRLRGNRNPAWRVMRCSFFQVERVRLCGEASWKHMAPKCDIFFGLKGSSSVFTDDAGVELAEGGVCLVPAAAGLRGAAPSCGAGSELLRITPGPSA